MSSKIIFICGPHCSGKTSILKALMEQNIIGFRGSEIGKDLYYERKFMTSKQDAEFEFEIAQKELERDNNYSNESKLIGVETWHPGNIAYAAVRNPETVKQLIEIAKKSPLIDEAYGIWLRIPSETIKQRTKTFENESDWAAKFYSEIDDNIEMSLSGLGLLEKTTIIDAEKPIEQAIEEVIKVIKSLTKVTV